MRDVSPDAVFNVLRDGRSFGHWVVGTRKIRSIESGWPDEGKRIHYTVGYWPLRKDDETRSLRYQPDRMLELEARAWPALAVSGPHRRCSTGGLDSSAASPLTPLA
jgi:hypothetical protein